MDSYGLKKCPDDESSNESIDVPLHVSVAESFAVDDPRELIVNFPVKLHYMLTEIDSKGPESIISWQSHGRCFKIHEPEQFVRLILPQYVADDTVII
jgi:HSF-type DNA-binding